MSSSVESVDTFYSTTTVRSFAFHTGTLGGGCNGLSLDVLGQAGEVGPFAAGASKVAVGNKENESAASTLPANVHRRDITARYSLQLLRQSVSPSRSNPLAGISREVGGRAEGWTLLGRRQLVDAETGAREREAASA